MEEADQSSTADQYLSDEDVSDLALEIPRNIAGRIDALNYLSLSHPLLPPPRARSVDSLVVLRSRVRHHTAFWWDLFLAMQQNKNPKDYQAVQAESARQRQENGRLKQTIGDLRQQGYKDRATIDYLATPLNGATQWSGATSLVTEQEPPQRMLNDSVKERKRKRNRISCDSIDEEIL